MSIIARERLPRQHIRHAIREVGADDIAAMNDVVKLHMRLLDFGPMAALGDVFIREVCYRIQVASDLLRVALYEVEGRPAGFVAYTGKSLLFHREALTRHWPYVLWVLGWSLLRDPRRIIGLVTALRVVRSRRAELRFVDGALGEVVCLAVLPDYLSHQFVASARLRISEELVRYAMDRLRQQGLSRMRMIVNADNKAVLFLYHRLGARFEPYEQGGVPSVQVWFDLNASGG